MQPIWNALNRMIARLARDSSLCLSALAIGDTPSCLNQFQQACAGLGSVADAVFDVRRQLCRALLVLGQPQQGVVAEAVFAARCVKQLAGPVTFCDQRLRILGVAHGDRSFLALLAALHASPEGEKDYRFLLDHLNQWTPEFFGRIEKHDRTGFYRDLSRFAGKILLA